MFKWVNKIMLSVVLLSMFSGIVFAQWPCKEIVILGYAGTGKSTLRDYLLQKDTRADRVSTLSVNFEEASLRLIDGNTVLCRIWDTPKYDSFDDQLSNIVIGHADVVFVVIDCSATKPHNAEYKTLMEEAIKLYVTTLNSKFPKSKVIIVVNKVDLLDSDKNARYQEDLQRVNALYADKKFDVVLTSLTHKDKMGCRELERLLMNSLSGGCASRTGCVCARRGCSQICYSDSEYSPYCTYACKTSEEIAMRKATENPVYRLYNAKNGDHLLTISAAEKESCERAGWKYEGIAFMASGEGMEVYRLYNPRSGEHFYTTSVEERDVCTERYRWRSEGIAFKTNGSKEVYRLYSDGMHIFTTSKAEKDNLVARGWKYEGIGFYAN